MSVDDEQTTSEDLVQRKQLNMENITGNSHIILEACHGTANTS